MLKSRFWSILFYLFCQNMFHIFSQLNFETRFGNLSSRDVCRPECETEIKALFLAPSMFRILSIMGEPKNGIYERKMALFCHSHSMHGISSENLEKLEFVAEGHMLVDMDQGVMRCFWRTDNYTACVNFDVIKSNPHCVRDWSIKGSVRASPAGHEPALLTPVAPRPAIIGVGISRLQSEFLSAMVISLNGKSYWWPWKRTVQSFKPSWAAPTVWAPIGRNR